MLIKKDCKNQFKSSYVCDRCGVEVDVKHKIGLFKQEYLSNQKKYCDLCFDCFKAMERGIKNGKKKRQGASEKANIKSNREL